MFKLDAFLNVWKKHLSLKWLIIVVFLNVALVSVLYGLENNEGI